jgi:flagellar motility protein MotE (MotC chaperone)
LDEREQELQQKAAILQAAELRVDQKVKDMEKLRAQLQTMLGQLSETQQAQIDNLVKIYEAMKPKEAARILQTLDLPVLLGVMKLMKPAKSAPILAEMDAAKAKDITMTLARQGDIPDTKAAN